MVLEYDVKEIYTTLITFGYSNALEILIAIITIVITITLSLWFRSSTAKQSQEDDEEEDENDEILKIGLQARFKKAQQKVIEEKLGSEDRDKEKEIESQSLMKIMKLFQERKDLFPESSMDDLKKQLNLYRTQ